MTLSVKQFCPSVFLFPLIRAAAQKKNLLNITTKWKTTKYIQLHINNDRQSKLSHYFKAQHSLTKVISSKEWLWWRLFASSAMGFQKTCPSLGWCQKQEKRAPKEHLASNLAKVLYKHEATLTAAWGGRCYPLPKVKWLGQLHTWSHQSQGGNTERFFESFFIETFPNCRTHFFPQNLKGKIHHECQPTP